MIPTELNLKDRLSNNCELRLVLKDGRTVHSNKYVLVDMEGNAINEDDIEICYVTQINIRHYSDGKQEQRIEVKDGGFYSYQERENSTYYGQLNSYFYDGDIRFDLDSSIRSKCDISLENLKELEGITTEKEFEEYENKKKKEAKQRENQLKRAEIYQKVANLQKQIADMQIELVQLEDNK